MDDSEAFLSDPRAGRRAALFLGGAVVLLAFLAGATLLRQGAFTQHSRLYFFSQTAQGIFGGMSVNLSGFRIGSVERLELQPDGQVRVELRVKSEYLRHIPQGGAARLVKEGLVGASFIDVLAGTRQSRPIAQDGVLEFERGEDFGQIAEALADKLHPILDELRKVTASVNDPQGDIARSLRNVQLLSQQLLETRVELTRAAQSAGERAAAVSHKVENVLDKAAGTLEEVNGTVRRAGASLDAVNGMLQTLDARLPGMLIKLDHTLLSVQGVADDARRISTGLAAEVPATLQSGRTLVDDSGELLQGVRQSWPLRQLITAPAEKPLPLDSHDGLPAAP